MIDIALALDRLVPGGDWQGSVTEDFIQRDFGGDQEAAYNAIRWNDARTQPSFSAVLVEGQIILAEPVLGFFDAITENAIYDNNLGHVLDNSLNPVYVN